MISDADVRRLIAGTGEEDIVEYDVSDARLYGRKYYRRLTGELAAAAEAAGCAPEVYQSVYWWTFIGVPVWSRGVYLVLPRQDCDDPDGDADQYRCLRVPTDRQQVNRHFTIGCATSLAVVCVIVALLVSARRHARRPSGGFRAVSSPNQAPHRTAATCSVPYTVSGGGR